MHKGFIRAGALLAALAVILGAFGAHSLRPLLTERQGVTFETAVRYHFYHSFALILAGVIFRELPGLHLRWAGRLFGIGVLIFSGSLYLLTGLNLLKVQGFDWLGAVTPLGGLCFVAGWLFLAFATVRKSQASS